MSLCGYSVKVICEGDIGMRTDNPFAPWNKERYKDDPFAAWNHPMHKDDPFAPWNKPMSHKEDFDRYEKEHCLSPYHPKYGNW